MNIKQQALGGFKKDSDEVVLVKARTVLLAMTDNPNFTTPDPSLATLETAVADYEAKLALAKRPGSPEDTANKKESRKEVEGLLKRLAFYVTHTADGNLPKLLSSGFTISSVPQRNDVPAVVTGIKLSDGRQRGQVRLDFDKNPSAKIYEYQICSVDLLGQTGEWGEVYTTTSSKINIIAPLEQLQRYGVRVRAVNGYGKSDWSEMVTHVVR